MHACMHKKNGILAFTNRLCGCVCVRVKMEDLTILKNGTAATDHDRLLEGKKLTHFITDDR